VNSRLERRQSIAGRLDHHLTLAVALDLAFPSIYGNHRGVHVDAGREPLVDELTAPLLGAVVGGRGGEDQDDVGHSSTIPKVESCTFGRIGVPSSRVATGEKSSAKRRIPTARRPARTRRIIQALLVCVAIVVLVDALVGERGLVALLRARQAHDQLAAAIARQRAENARLRDEARQLRDDPATIEEIARRELGLLQPGEKVFIIKDVAPPSSEK
jgi:cell division protein FtsB